MSATQLTRSIPDAGLRHYMLGVYRHMTLALLVSGTVAFLIPHTPAFMDALYIRMDGTITGLEPLAAI